MTKAEKFIKDYTNYCSNELEGGVYHEWLTPEQARRAVEIAREEALQEEPVSKVWHGTNETPNYVENDSYIGNYDHEKVDKALLHLQEESVSDDLVKAADFYSNLFSDIAAPYIRKDAFIAGANWKEEQFEKNRLKHCDSITNEQAELEQGFIDQHLDKYQRMPTFLDAIEYGMKLQEEKDNICYEEIIEEGAQYEYDKIIKALLSEVLPCFIHGGEADEVIAKLDEVLNRKDD